MTEPTTGTPAADDAARKIPQIESALGRPEPQGQAEDPDYVLPGRPEAAGSHDNDQSDDGQDGGNPGDGRPAPREARYRRERNEARAQVKELEARIEGLLMREVARIAGDTLADAGPRQSRQTDP